jgi:tRNA pseudouridine38-40 synthase
VREDCVVPTYRLDIAYEGTRFSGWATQPGERTVQEVLEGAIGQLTGEAVTLTVAGRTDAGVHAHAQVASFDLAKPPPETTQRALNALTPTDVSITGFSEARAGFDARRDALSRRYRYRVETAYVPDPFERRYALHESRPLDRGALDECASLLVGVHDFTAFTPTETEHVHFRRRIIDAGWSVEPGGILRFEIEADAFLRSMVRIVVGTVLEVGRGRRDIDDLRRLLGGAERKEAGETARPHGLHLIGVSY